MENKVKHRFRQSKDPNGKSWAANSEVTIERKKSSKAGSDSGRLRGSMTNKHTEVTATAGTNVVYAKTFNFGAKKGEFKSRNVTAKVKPFTRTTKYGTHSVRGHTRKIKTVSPWGKVPARRFIGFSKNQRKLYVRWIKEHLEVRQ